MSHDGQVTSYRGQVTIRGNILPEAIGAHQKKSLSKLILHLGTLDFDKTTRCVCICVCMCVCCSVCMCVCVCV